MGPLPADARVIAEELTVRQVRLSLGGSVYEPHDPVRTAAHADPDGSRRPRRAPSVDVVIIDSPADAGTVYQIATANRLLAADMFATPTAE